MPDVIVIGGGIVGACTAWQLAERGAEVLVLERGELAGGATRRSQGLLLDPDHHQMAPLFAESNRAQLIERVLHEEPIPFPLGNWRADFVRRFRRAIDDQH